MRKVNIFVIVRDHIATLYDDRTGKLSVADMLFFYLLPAGLSLAYFFFSFPLPKDVNSALIAVFSVFGALLFSAQMALYGLSPKAPAKCEDTTSTDREMQRFQRDRKFFSDVNYNVSYLILLSCVSLIVFVAMMATDFSESVEGAVLIFIVSHFFLTLLMLVKRTHIAFSSKYTENK